LRAGIGRKLRKKKRLFDFGRKLRKLRKLKKNFDIGLSLDERHHFDEAIM
jgi:hypothetical protein